MKCVIDLYEKSEDFLIEHYNFNERESILKYQVLLLHLLMVLSGITIGIMSIIRFLEHNYVQALADLLFILFLGINFYILYHNKQRFKVIARIVIGVAILLVLTVMYTKPDSFAPVVWLMTVIYLMFFLLNKTEAWRWFLVVMFFLIFAYITGYVFQIFNYSDMFVLTGNILLLLLVLTWYERVKEENEDQYQKNQILLKKEIARQTLELQKSNSELEVLNSNLEERVEEEIEKNREKDQIMLAQSRQAAMGDMISMIAHQWRQPITAIGMGAQNLQLDIKLDEIDPERFETKLEKIVEQTHYLSKTIDDFRNFLKPNKTAQTCRLSIMMEDALSIIDKSLENSNITLEKSYENDREIITFGNEVIQVLLNIINNAKDIINIQELHDGHIRIVIDADEQNACFKIYDNAGGIPEDVLPRIFEPYFTTKESKGGTGLGLYMSQMIVEKHLHGKIMAENIGEGVCFTVTLPSLETQEK